MAIVLWNKKYTETLAETLKRFRFEKPEFETEKVTYAGRLDPMAEGLLILLTGGDVHKKDEFLGLDKVYEIDFIFGPSTDTYDILGLVNNSSDDLIQVDIDNLGKALREQIKSYQQSYPPYSSKPVNGKPLFMWAREDKLDEIKIPHKNVEVYNVKYAGLQQQDTNLFKEKIIHDIESVKGDFRQDEIINFWHNYFQAQKNDNICIYRIRVHASSGTYMRSIVQNLGQFFATQACTVKITRVSVGNYSL